MKRGGTKISAKNIPRPGIHIIGLVLQGKTLTGSCNLETVGFKG